MKGSLVAERDLHDLVGAEQVAEICGVSMPTVRFWIRARLAASKPANLGPAPVHGNGVWCRADVEAWRDAYRPLT